MQAIEATLGRSDAEAPQRKAEVSRLMTRSKRVREALRTLD
jgi:hypothetical protein